MEAYLLATNFTDDKEKRKEKVACKFIIGAKVLKNPASRMSLMMGK